MCSYNNNNTKTYIYRAQHDMNVYGAHPFYMVCETDGSSHGVFLYNSHSIGISHPP